MKRKLNTVFGAFAVTAVISAAMLTGCSKNTQAPEDSQKENAAGTEAGTAVSTEAEKKAPAASEHEKLKVMASFYPMYDFAVKIGGDKAVVMDMVPAGTEPHDWEPAATDIKNLEEADVFIYSGAGMEFWVPDVLASLDNKKLVSAEASQGLKLREGGEEEEEEGDHKHAEDPNQVHYDPHVWLSPMNAKKEMENIKAAFVKADPDNQAYYESNYKMYADKFDQLDQKYKDTLSALPNKDIVASHEAFGYLCDAYGLNQVGIDGLNPDSEPDPARMADIIDFVKANHVKVIFFEELVSPKVAETVARETGAETDVLNPLEGLSDEELKSGEDYFSVMEDNLKHLAEALK